MIRLALAYLTIAVVAIILVTGLPFGLSGTDPVPEVTALTEDLVVPVSTSAEDLAIEAASLSLIDRSISETTALILNHLESGSDPAAGDSINASDTVTALAALQAARTPGEVTLESLLVQAIAAGQTADEIDELLTDAVGQGSVRVPAMMITTEGGLDIPVLIASILAKSLTSSTEQGDTSVGDSYITPETAILDIQDIEYSVLAGDSLGALSLKFYGTPAHAEAILAANRQIIATPSSLRAGQVLLIPSRSKL